MNNTVNEAATAVRDRATGAAKAARSLVLLAAGYVAQPAIVLVQDHVTDPLKLKLGEAAKTERGQQALQKVSKGLEATVDIACNRKVQIGAGLSVAVIAAALVVRRRNT